MRFESPWLLLFLLLIPAVFAFVLWIDRRQARYAVAFTNIDVLASVAVARRSTWRRWVPLALFLLALAFAATALGRPNAEVSTATSRATIVLLVDVSGSMRADDVKPTRLGAAQAAMFAFLDRVPKHVRVGLVSFSTSPQLLVPPTTNRGIMREGVDLLEPESGTAIGDGLQDAVNTVLSSIGHNAPRGKNGHIPAAIVLLSDGAQTRGTLAPLKGAQLAKDAGIPVYTIALGTKSGVLHDNQFGFGFGGGGGGGNFPVPPDPATLGQIAAATGGLAFQAESAEKVEAVYKRLSNSVVTKQQRREISSWFAGAAAFFLLGSLAAAKATGERLP
ncbi:MAG TPA: VWA domain-containing protein [Gaiellaceae bacterium]|nr:VWA domain-containing protein [Gaiellaceae bacterium]